jgi:glycosyltransferase involved in cell wall biosynthesis
MPIPWPLKSYLTEKMRVLQLCSKVPYPAKDGGCMAMLNLADMLHNNGCEVKILAMETHKHPAPINGYPTLFNQKYKPESVFVSTKTSLLSAMLNLLYTNASYHLVRFKNQQFQQKLIATLKSYKPDIVILDSLFTCGYIDEIKANTNAKIIYRAHNVEYVIWKEIALKTKSFFKKKYLQIQSERLKNEELHLISKVDGIAAITAKDSDFFKSHFADKKLITLPFTVDLKDYNDKNEYGKKAIFFIGAMDWYPNLEGVKWFIDKVWGSVLHQHPTAKFYIAGKAMPDELKKLEEKNIINLGEVDDAKTFMEKHPLMIAPIFSGGGLKIKIIEAMAMGKIVVCNPEAATGIPITDKVNILLADSSLAFIDVISECFNHVQELPQIGRNARLLIEGNFSSSERGVALKMFLKSIE